MATVVLVDDEVHNTSFLTRRLQAKGYEVHYCQGPMDVRSLVETNVSIDLIVTDLMMSDQGAYGLSGHGEYFTGACLVEDIRSRLPGVPIIIYTRASVDLIRRELAERMKGIENVFVMVATFTDRLDETVDLFLAQGIEPGRKKSLLKRLTDSLVLQPNISGLGIDLKKLL